MPYKIKSLVTIKKYFKAYLRVLENNSDKLEGLYFEVPFSEGFRLVVTDGYFSGMAGDLEIDFYSRENDYGCVSATNSAHGLDYMVAFVKNFAAIKSDTLVAAKKEGALDFMDNLAAV